MFWSGEALIERLSGDVNDFDPKAIDCNAWKLTVGDKVYVTPNAQAAKSGRHTIETLEPGAAFSIPPQQFAFLQTHQTVKVPNNAMGFISIRSTIKLHGLVNVSGFHVDPGYEGRLVFTVFNAGPRPIHLEEGQEIFLMWFADIDRASEYTKKIPSDLAVNGKIIAPVSGGLQNLADIELRVENLENSVNKHRAIAKTLGWALGIAIALCGVIFGAIAALSVLPDAIDFLQGQPLENTPTDSQTAPPTPAVPTTPSGPATPPAPPPTTTGAPSNAR